MNFYRNERSSIMGFFDFLAKAQEKINAQAEALTQKAEAGSWQPVQLNKADKKKQLIISKFYADYPETPYISDERKEDWIEMAEQFPKQCIIPKSMMVRFSEGLLPGHVYMLHWLKKYTNKKVPAYFEYKYGIDFEKEKIFLHENGFLNDIDKPTDKGELAIKQHCDVIECHTPPKPDLSIEGISKQILALRDSLIRNGFKEYEFISNKECCPICKELNGKHFLVCDLKIGVNAPPMHEGCTCSIAAYSNDETYEKWLNSL